MSLEPVKVNYEVGIVGGGSAGLWLAYWLSKRNISCVVVDEEPFAGYASTRNQGWLHSGALYAGIGDEHAAIACKIGFDFIHEFTADNKMADIIDEDLDCYLLFSERRFYDRAIQICIESKASAGSEAGAESEAGAKSEAGIQFEEIDVTEVPEQILEGQQKFVAALKVKDRRINNHQLMGKVAELAGKAGTKFCAVPRIKDLDFSQGEQNWEIIAGGERITCAVLVLTCGPYIPFMLERLVPEPNHGLQATRIHVISIYGKVSQSLLATPQTLLGPSVVPFGLEGNTGVTICLFREDEDIETEEELSDLEASQEELENRLNVVRRFYPGFAELVRTGELMADVYICQKLKKEDPVHELQSVDAVKETPLSRERLLLSYEPNLIAYYPGKFTTAPTTSQDCADEVEGMLANLNLEIEPRNDADSVPIARQKYYREPQYEVYLEGQAIKVRLRPDDKIT